MKKAFSATWPPDDGSTVRKHRTGIRTILYYKLFISKFHFTRSKVYCTCLIIYVHDINMTVCFMLFRSIITYREKYIVRRISSQYVQTVQIRRKCIVIQIAIINNNVLYNMFNINSTYLLIFCCIIVVF